MYEDSNLPRFHFFFEHIQGKSVHSMSRDSWDAIQSTCGTPVLIDIQDTPFSETAHNANILAVTASRYSDKSHEITIYREDLKDPLPINKDTYYVLDDLVHHPEYHTIVQEASTCDNKYLRNYLSERVFLVKKDDQEDHWLPDLPDEIKLIIEKTT